VARRSLQQGQGRHGLADRAAAVVVVVIFRGDDADASGVVVAIFRGDDYALQIIRRRREAREVDAVRRRVQVDRRDVVGGRDRSRVGLAGPVIVIVGEGGRGRHSREEELHVHGVGTRARVCAGGEGGGSGGIGTRNVGGRDGGERRIGGDGAVVVSDVPTPPSCEFSSLSSSSDEYPVARVAMAATSGCRLSHGALYGDVFHVRAGERDAINAAYTSDGLRMHQDLA